MHYQEYHPTKALSPYIETYWITNDFRGEGEFYKVLPDGCVDIVVSFDRAKSAVYASIVGTMTSFLEVSYPQTAQVFGIRFKPGGITAFTRIPINEFTDRNVELAMVDTLFDKSFYEALPEKKSAKEIVTHTNHYLINRLPHLYRSEQQIVRAVDLMYLAKGRLSPAKVASEVCLCQRHFERKFKSAIGISPKAFANVLRFKQALRCLRKQPHQDLLSVAVECGYYDHTHLIKEFRAFAGNTPTALR